MIFPEKKYPPLSTSALPTLPKGSTQGERNSGGADRASAPQNGTPSFRSMRLPPKLGRNSMPTEVREKETGSSSGYSQTRRRESLPTARLSGAPETTEPFRRSERFGSVPKLAASTSAPAVSSTQRLSEENWFKAVVTAVAEDKSEALKNLLTTRHELLSKLSQDKSDGTSLMSSALAHPLKWDALIVLIKEIPDIIDVNKELSLALPTGQFLLHEAVSRGDTSAVETLINKGADVNLKKVGHLTALQIAAQKGKVAIAGLLLKKGADTTPGGDNRTAAMLSAIEKTNSSLRGMTRQLVERSADISPENIKKIMSALKARRSGLQDERTEAQTALGEIPRTATLQSREEKTQAINSQIQKIEEKIKFAEDALTKVSQTNNRLKTHWS